MSKELKQIFLEGCNAIADLMEDVTFKRLQKGQSLKKTSLNKDLTFEIFFETSIRNTKYDIVIRPRINIYSKKVKNWEKENAANPDGTGCFYSAGLEDLSPLHKADYNLAGLSGKESIEKITDLIKNYVLPLFDLFEDTNNVIKFLAENGTKFNEYTSQTLMPLSFLLCFGSKEDAENYFNKVIDSYTNKGSIIRLYKELGKAKKIDLRYNEFYQAGLVKLAFVNGLKINTM